MPCSRASLAGSESAEASAGRLVTAARQAREHAVADFSHFKVGAALETDTGEIITGCNIENASYGLTLCAECGLISALHASGGGRLVAVACVNGTGAVLMPCGRCRQLLWEHGGAECLIDTPAGTWLLSAALPQAFGADDLARVENEH